MILKQASDDGSDWKEKYRRFCKRKIMTASSVSSAELSQQVIYCFFSEDEADSLADDYMRHRQHHRGKMLTSGSGSPGCVKVGEARAFLFILFSSGVQERPILQEFLKMPNGV